MSRYSKKLYVLIVARLVGVGVAVASPFGSGKTVGPASARTPAPNSAANAMLAFHDPSAIQTAPLPTTLPASVIGALANLPAPSQGQGVRVALRLVDLAGADLYAFATTGGSVCYVAPGDAATDVSAGSCIDTFSARNPVGWTLYRVGMRPWDVIGVAPDNITAVTVEFGSTAVRATLQNGFFRAVGPSDAAPGGVTVVSEDISGTKTSQSAPDLSHLGALTK